MASPMSFFRRYQKGLLAVFGVGLMFIFLLGMITDNTSDLLGTFGQKRKDPLVVKWRGGQLTRNQLDDLRIRHYMTKKFLDNLYEFAASKSDGKPFQPFPIGLVPVPDPQQADMEQIDATIVSRQLLLQKAQQEGIVVSDGMVDDFFRIFVGPDVELTNKDLLNLIRNATDGRMDLHQLRAQMQVELAILQMDIINRSGQGFTTVNTYYGPSFHPNPTEALQFFSRVNSKVSAEYIPISVADYLPKVKAEPSNSEINTIFQEGKYRFLDDTYQEPGFKIRQRLAIQYFMLDTEKFLQADMDKLSDKVVQEEYDRLVKAEDPLVMEIIPDDPKIEGEKAPDPTISNDPAKPGESTKTEDPAPKPEDPAPKPDETKTDEPKKDGSPDPKPEGSDPPPATDPAKSDPPKKEGDGESNASLTQSIDEQFISIQDPQSETTQDPSKADPATTEPAKASESDKGTTVDQDPAKTDAPPATDPATPPQSTPGETVSGQAPAGQVDDQVTAPKRRPRPLKDVEQSIRRRLVQAESLKKANENLTEASFVVRDYANGPLAEAETEAQNNNQEFEANDFPKFEGDEVAKKFGLTFHEISLMDENALAKTDFGKMVIFDSQFRPIPMSSIVFAQFASMRHYEPSEPINFQMQNSLVVFWFTEIKKQEIPKLEVVRDDVVNYWKRKRALDAALEDAKRLAEKASSANGSLTEIADNPDQVKQTGEFTWYSDRNMSGLGLSHPEGIDDPGEKFMETVFQLDEGKTGFVANAGHDTVYVVRLLTKQKQSGPELNRDFITEVAAAQNIPNQIQYVAFNYNQQLAQDVRNKLIKEMNVEWVGE